MKLKTKLVENLTPKEYKRLYDLNLRKNGFMQYDLCRCRTAKDLGRVFFIEINNIVISWILTYTDINFNRTFHVYTRVKYRHKGYATILKNKVSAFYKVY